MDNMLLSLKNIYRLLMIQDFPIYSNAVFTEKNRKGLTLVKFWQSCLVQDFRTGKYGKMLWRSEGKRNRHISSVINRTGTRPAYTNYELECIQLLTPLVVKQQQEIFVDFLEKREFSPDAFIRRLKAYLDLLHEDPCLNEESILYLQNCYTTIEENIEDKYSHSQYCGWMLALLTIFALAGSQMGTLLEHSCLMSLSPVANLFSEKPKTNLNYLTICDGALRKKPLPHQHFFGRERELFELRQMIPTGKHYLISGMGGIGKTELLRQLLHICEEENLCDAVALISYGTNMAMSFITAFGETGKTDLDTNFKEILGRIRLLKDKRILILIDNMNHTVTEDKYLSDIMDLPATILATSRVRELPGFITFEIKSLNIDAGSLIFRDHYKKIMTETNQEILARLLNVEAIRHPLTLRFLGRITGFGNKSLDELGTQLIQRNNLSFPEENSVPVLLRQVYEQVYQLHNLSRKDRLILNIYTQLPYNSYSGNFLQTYFLDSAETEIQIENRLNALYWLGFLEKSGKEFSMHPFIAECLRNSTGNPNKYFFDRVFQQILRFLKADSEDLSHCLEADIYTDVFAKAPQLGELCRILLYYEKNFSIRKYSQHQIGILLLAIEVVGRVYGFSEEMYRKLSYFRHNYPDLPLPWRLRCLILEATNLKMYSSEYSQMFKEYNSYLSANKPLKNLYEYFCVAYIKTLMHETNSEKALEECKNFFEKLENPKLKLELSKTIMTILSRTRSHSEIAHWLEISETLLDSESDTEMYREFLMQKGRYYFFLEQWEQFQNIQNQLCASIQEKDIRWQYESLYWKGMGEVTRNENENAIDSFLSSREYAMAYWGKEHINVAYLDQALGVAFYNLKQYEQSIFYTEESCRIFSLYPAEKFMQRRLKNNIGHLYMTIGKPEEARICFTELYEELLSQAEDMDVAIMALVCDNLAKTFHELQNPEEEQRWLAQTNKYNEKLELLSPKYN